MSSHAGKRLRLLHLIVAVAAITLLIWLLVPWMRRKQIARNETAAIGLLRKLERAQAIRHQKFALDRDGDRVAEWATLEELVSGAGASALVDSPRWVDLEGDGRALASSGYLFTVHLAPVRQGDTPVDAAERAYVVYAWPVVRGQTGWRAFVTSNLADYCDYCKCGHVMGSANYWKTGYSGSNHSPPPAAAFTIPAGAVDWTDGTLLNAGSGSDGHTWLGPGC